jgi:hypothetical protein
LVVVELKQGNFKPEYKGQMELYLRWLAQNEREPEENLPLGIILCAGKNTEQIELLELDAAGIHAASRFNIGRPRPYALVCRSDSSLLDEFDTAAPNTEKIVIGELTNIVTGRPLGSSQVTAVVERRVRHGLSSAECSVKFRAKLVPPYFIQLSAPKPIGVEMACSCANRSMEGI